MFPVVRADGFSERDVAPELRRFRRCYLEGNEIYILKIDARERQS